MARPPLSLVSPARGQDRWGRHSDPRALSVVLAGEAAWAHGVATQLQARLCALVPAAQSGPSPAGVVETRLLGPTPDPLSQNLHVSRVPGDLCAHGVPTHPPRWALPFC